MLDSLLTHLAKFVLLVVTLFGSVFTVLKTEPVLHVDTAAPVTASTEAAPQPTPSSTTPPTTQALPKTVALIGDSTAFNVASVLEGEMVSRGIAFTWSAAAGCAFVGSDVGISMNNTMGPGYTTCPNWREEFARAVAGADVVVLRADGTPLADMIVNGVAVSIEDPVGYKMLEEAMAYMRSIVTGKLVVVNATPLHVAGADGTQWVVNRSERTALWNGLMARYADSSLDFSPWLQQPGIRTDGAHIAAPYREAFAACLSDALLAKPHSCNV